ncbi:MAG: hypothetical protein ACLRWP_20525 [Bilophila wadsworthia]
MRIPVRYLANLLAAGDESRCARRFPVCSPCAATCGTVNSSPRLPRRSRPCARIPIRREYWPMPV